MVVKIRSLRVRLILTFTLIFGAIQLVLGVIGLTARENYIDAYFDDQLMRRVDGIISSLVRSEDSFSGQALSEMISRETRTAYFRDFYLQVVSSEGKLIDHSLNLGDMPLPLSQGTLAQAQHGGRVFETVGGEVAGEIAGPSQQLRVVTTYLRPPGREPVFVQVATSLQQMEESKAFVRQLFLVGIPLGLLAAAVASWFAADRAVRAISEVTRLAVQTTPDDLGHRVEVGKPDDEVGQMVMNINQMLDRLEAGFHAQQRFVHDASHELKTPVSVLLSEAQVLQYGKPGDAEYQKFVRSVQHEMQRLGRLIESLLMITRSDGRNLVRLSRIESVNDLVVDVVARQQGLARRYGVGLRISLPDVEDVPEAGLAIRGDAELCEAMLGNLIRNAIKYSPSGSTVLVVVRPPVDGQVDIRVEDEGPCIPDDEKETIFSRFVRGSTRGNHQGSGLGLAIARSVVELHRGRIWVEDLAGGRGCAFVVRLPLETQEAGKDMENDTEMLPGDEDGKKVVAEGGDAG